jgi:hypothetical protein
MQSLISTCQWKKSLTVRGARSRSLPWRSSRWPLLLVCKAWRGAASTALYLLIGCEYEDTTGLTATGTASRHFERERALSQLRFSSMDCDKEGSTMQCYRSTTDSCSKSTYQAAIAKWMHLKTIIIIMIIPTYFKTLIYDPLCTVYLPVNIQ